MIKKLLFLLIFGTGFLVCQAQEKVLEESHKKEPDWLRSMQKGYIITTAKATNIEGAKEKAQQQIMEEIVGSVASYVKSSSQLQVENVDRDNVMHYMERFTQQSEVQTANIPFLQGISLNKAEGYYWEKVRNKDTDEIYYYYHVKYPFSEFERREIIAEFNKQDQEMSDKLNAIIAENGSFTSLEEIQSNIRELEKLSGYFMDSRKEKTELEITKLEEMLNSVQIATVINKPGVLKYVLRIGNKNYAYSKPAIVRQSDCIQIMAKEQEKAVQVIKYDHEYCYEDEENYINVQYYIGNHSPKHKFMIDFSEGKVEIFVKDAMKLKSTGKSNGQVESILLEVPLVAKYNGQFRVDQIELELPGNEMLSFDNIQAEYMGEGIHTLVTTETGEKIPESTFLSYNGASVNGTIYYIKVSTGETLRYKLFNHKIYVE